MAIDDSKDAMDNFVEYSFKFCPYCGRNAKLAKQHFETCHDDKNDPGTLGHYFTCECDHVWVDWYKYDETAR